MKKKKEKKENNWIDKVVNSLRDSFSNHPVEVTSRESYYIDLYNPELHIEVVEKIGTFEKDKDLIIFSEVNIDNGVTTIVQNVGNIKNGLFERLHDGKLPLNGLKLIKSDSKTHDSMDLRKAACATAQRHKEKLESSLKGKFDFEYTPMYVGSIFTGRLK